MSAKKHLLAVDDLESLLLLCPVNDLAQYVRADIIIQAICCAILSCR